MTEWAFFFFFFFFENRYFQHAWLFEIWNFFFFNLTLRLMTKVALEIFRALLQRRRWRSCTYSVWSPGMVSSQWEFSSLSCTYTVPPGRPAHLCGTPHLLQPSVCLQASLFSNCCHYCCFWAWELLILSPPSSKHHKAKIII